MIGWFADKQARDGMAVRALVGGDPTVSQYEDLLFGKIPGLLDKDRVMDALGLMGRMLAITEDDLYRAELLAVRGWLNWVIGRASIATDHLAAPAPITTPAQSQAWRCHDGGPNKICDTVTTDLEDTAWRVWAAQAGAKHIRVDGSRPFKVEVIGYASVTPRLTPDQLALTDGGVAYVYGVHYLD